MGRTLEEIEALAAEANESGETTRTRTIEFPGLLAIAQGQRARIQAAFDLISESGCDCDEEDRELEDVHICLAGRIEAALKGIGTKK